MSFRKFDRAKCQTERGFGGTKMQVDELASTGDAVGVFSSFCRGVTGDSAARVNQISSSSNISSSSSSSSS